MQWNLAPFRFYNSPKFHDALSFTSLAQPSAFSK